MTRASFLFQNFLDTPTIQYSSQHTNFPASNIQQRWYTRSWRSRYGAGSGWGNFIIDSTNKYIDFDEGGAELVGTLIEGSYSADSLCTQIKTQMDAAGALIYTVAYNDSTNKFMIAASGAFTLRWATGTHTGTNVGSTIGFDISANDTGATSYTADFVRIHSEEWVKINRGASAPGVTAIALRYNNFSTNATIQIQGHSSDSWGSPSYNQVLAVNNALMFHFPASAQSLQWWRIRVRDRVNSNGYIELGRAFVGTYFSPTVNCRTDYSVGWEDPSDIDESDGGQISSNKKTKFEIPVYVFEYATAADLASFRTMWNYCGRTKEFFFIRDRDDAVASGMYCRFADRIQYEHIQMESLYRVYVMLTELR